MKKSWINPDIGRAIDNGKDLIVIFSEINKHATIKEMFNIIGVKAKGANLPDALSIAPKSATIEIIGKNKIVNLDNVMIWFKRAWFDWNPGAINKINSFIKIWRIIVKAVININKIIKINFENCSAFLLFFPFNNPEYTGKKEEVKAPSAVILRNKLGTFDAIKKMSECIPAPKK